MSSEQFRRQLRNESQQWQQDGLIDPRIYEQLANRYDFQTLEETSSNRFIGILLGVGGILLGLGAITFVAANWQEWSRTIRVILLFTTFLGVNTGGYYLWNRPNSRVHRLGHALLLTGGLILGANLGLMSQMFHQSGPFYQLLIVWGLGVLAMAYGLRLFSLGIFSWILMLVGYLNFVGNSGMIADGTIWHQVMLYFPLGISVLYLPLAHGLRSQSILGLWGASFILSFALSQTIWFTQGASSPWAIASTLTLPPMVLWVYHSQFWQFNLLGGQPSASPRLKSDAFQSIGQSLCIWATSLTLYWFSYRFWWRENPFANAINDEGQRSWAIPLSLGLYLAMAVYGSWRWFQLDRDRSQPRVQWLKTPLLALILLGLYGLGVAFSRGTPLSIIGPVMINMLAFILSVVLIHDGLRLGIRRRFWGGMSLLVISLISRMFEYNTALILKAIVLTVCGLGIIAAGLWFEYQAKLATERTTLPERAS